jgi:hypothetical protein
MARELWLARRGGVRRSDPGPSSTEKQAVAAACEKLLAEVLRPRFLPEIRPTPYNYPIALYGKWHGSKFRFIVRFRCDRADAVEPEFEWPFARLAYLGRDCFDLSYRRYTEEWVGLYDAVSLAQALQLIVDDDHFQPC